MDQIPGQASVSSRAHLVMPHIKPLFECDSLREIKRRHRDFNVFLLYRHGQIVKQYTLSKRIAVGGFGVTWELEFDPTAPSPANMYPSTLVIKFFKHEDDLPSSAEVERIQRINMIDSIHESMGVRSTTNHVECCIKYETCRACTAPCLT